VTERSLSAADATRRLLPYALCTRSVCTSGCDPATRTNAKRLARGVSAAAQQIWTAAAGGADSLEPLVALACNAAQGRPQQAYCVTVHMALARDALHGAQTDIRPLLTDAVVRATGSAGTGGST
jgi:hypothetical protein